MAVPRARGISAPGPDDPAGTGEMAWRRSWTACGIGPDSPDCVVRADDRLVCPRAATDRRRVEPRRGIAAGRAHADPKKLFHDDAIQVCRLS